MTEASIEVEVEEMAEGIMNALGDMDMIDYDFLDIT